MRHLKYILTGIDLDTGAETHTGALIAIDDATVTYTARSLDRTRSETIQVPLDQAQCFLRMLAMVEAVGRPVPDLFRGIP